MNVWIVCLAVCVVLLLLVVIAMTAVIVTLVRLLCEYVTQVIEDEEDETKNLTVKNEYGLSEDLELSTLIVAIMTLEIVVEFFMPPLQDRNWWNGGEIRIPSTPPTRYQKKNPCPTSGGPCSRFA